MNYKGGTGKTATLVNVAVGLSLAGKRVLVVDTDPQGSAGYHLGVEADNTLYDVIMETRPVTDCIVSARKGLDIITANERLFPAELTISQFRAREHVLRQRLSQITGYDYIILDCAPSFNVLNQNALLYADEAFLPVSMEYMSLVGTKQLLNNIRLVNKLFNHHLKVTKVIPTFFDKRTTKSADILDSIKRVFPDRITSPIRHSVAVAESSGFGQSVFEYAPKSIGAQDFKVLVDEILEERQPNG